MSPRPPLTRCHLRRCALIPVALLGTLAASLLLFSGVSGRAAVVINEVCFDNQGNLADETGTNYSDWIELYNTGPESVNIGYYALGETSPYQVGRGVVLPSYTIPPHGFLVVFANGDGLDEHKAWRKPEINLIPENSTWYYYAGTQPPPAAWNTTNFTDPTWPSGISPLGYNDAKLNLDCATELPRGTNAMNPFPSYYFRRKFNLVDPPVITELVLKTRFNDGIIVYLNGRELWRANMPSGPVSHSTPATPIETNCWSTNVFSTSVLTPGLLMRGVNVLAVEVHQAIGGNQDVVMDLSLRAKVGVSVPFVHGGFSLADEGQDLYLFNDRLELQHYFVDPGLHSPGLVIGRNKSYGLFPNGNISAYRCFDEPTPWSANSQPRKYFENATIPKPTLSPPPGMYPSRTNIVFRSSSGTKIFYTLDGTDPALSTNYVSSGSSVAVAPATSATSGLSWIHTSPVEVRNHFPGAEWLAPIGSVAKVRVVRAITVSGDNTSCSAETRGTYFVGTQFTNRSLPVVSLITDTNNLFGFVSGLYVPGKYYADSPEGYGESKWGKPYANYHQNGPDLEWERPIYFELFETNQPTSVVSQLLGATMHGGGTRALPQKALYFHARLGEYGTDRIHYPLFPLEYTNTYKRFLLRSSGNDWYGPDFGSIATMMKDAVFHRIVKSLNMSVMAYRPTVAYINGEYWGIHNLRESYDKHYLATHYGVEADNCDILMHEEGGDRELQIESVNGPTNSVADFQAMLYWIQQNPLSIPGNYAKLQSSSLGVTNIAGLTVTNCTGMDVTNYADYIIAETFFGNKDWPINNYDFWRARTNQVASCGRYGDQRWRWMLYDLDVAGSESAQFPYDDMLLYLEWQSAITEAGFLINELWKSSEFNHHFYNRYANLLNTTFRPERIERIVNEAAGAIAPEIETHFRRWGRPFSQSQWRQAVNSTLVLNMGVRHSFSWDHLSSKFGLGGSSLLTVRNSDTTGQGGYFIVNGVPIATTTEGVTNRAAWTGRFFRNMAVPVQAVPDEGYVFDRWVDTLSTSSIRQVSGWELPLTLVAWFRPAGVPPSFQRWQQSNYTASQIQSGAAGAEASSGYAGLSNWQLYAFGMNTYDGLTERQRIARVSLSVEARRTAEPSELFIAYTRLNSTFTDVHYRLKVTADVTQPEEWRDAVLGQDYDSEEVTVLDGSSVRCEVRLRPVAANSEARYFRLETSPQ